MQLSAGDFSVTIENISKDKYQPTTVERAAKSIQRAIISGLPEGDATLKSELEWRLVSEAELKTSESAEGTLVSQGKAEWTISKRTLAAGIYQIKFMAFITIGDLGVSQTLKAFDYGFIQVVAAPVRAIIDGGSSVLWGSTEIIVVDGSLSYDGDIGPGNHTGLTFSWSCRDSPRNDIPLSNNCFGAFVDGRNGIAIRIDPRVLTVGKTYFLRLTVSKDDRRSFTEMSFEIAQGEIPQVTLR